MKRVLASAVLLVLAFNLIFLLLATGAALVPRDLLMRRVRGAFSTGDLVDQDFLPFDNRRGFFQYNDCLILVMITNRQGSLLADALGPRVYTRDEAWSNMCKTLHDVATDEHAPLAMLALNYTRYWHGNNVVASGLLSFLQLSQARWILRSMLCGTLVLLPFAAGWADRRLFAYAAVLGVMGLLFWAVPQIGPLLSQSPGESVAVLGVAVILRFRRWLARPDVLVPFCAAFGAVVVYLDYLTGTMPTAAGWLFATVFLAARARPTSSDATAAATQAGEALAAFALGAVLTVMLKQALAMLVFGSVAVQAFVSHLTMWSTPVHGAGGTSGVLRPFRVLLANKTMLTYGSLPLARLLLASTAVVWVLAGCLAFFHRRSSSISDVLACVIGVGAIPIWALLLQTHTVVHGTLMVRILIVPISLGWAALAWQMLDRDAGADGET
jgi:hypothetical protein